MNGKILGIVAALVLVAGCEFAKKTEWEASGATCVSTGGACTENRDCCSYGCGALGQCVANPVAGGACRTTNDCALAMLCKSEHCSSTATCRDDADVCSTAGQCCSKHCDGTTSKCVPNNAPVIQMGAATQDVPRNQPFTVVNTSYDPDGDSVSWGWTLTPIFPFGPGTLSPTNDKNPTFNPGSTAATYLLTLDATDFWGLVSSGTVTLNVVNTPPAVSPVSAALVTQRNGALQVKMNVSDANGDLLGCTWSICRPGSTTTCLTAPAPLTSYPGLPASQPLANFPVGLTSASEGTWEVSLTCTDPSLATTTGTATVTVNNTPPAIIVPATRTYNLGVDAASTPDASIAAAATDANGDSPIVWSWNVVTVPAGSLVDVTDLGATATASTAVFKPDVTGFYTFTVTACDPAASNPPWVDRPAGCSTQTVVSTVYPYIRPLGHGVSDAAFYRATSTARLVLVGPDGVGAGSLWDYDLVAGSAPVKTPLGGPPNAVTLTPDGGTAVAVDAASAFKVVLGPTPTKTTWTATATFGDVIAVSNSDAYVFPLTPGATAYGQHLSLSTGVFTAVEAPTGTFRTGAFGASVAQTASNTFLVADTWGSDLLRLKRQGSAEVFEASDTTYAGGPIWASGSGAHVFSSDGQIYAVPASPPSTTFSELGTTLGVSNVRHVDTSPTESVVLALADAAGEVRRYNSGFSLVAADALPHWGIVGSDRTVEGLFAFVSNDATRVYVVMRTTSGGAPEYGLYSYTLP